MMWLSSLHGGGPRAWPTTQESFTSQRHIAVLLTSYSSHAQYYIIHISGCGHSSHKNQVHLDQIVESYQFIVKIMFE